MIPSPFFSHPFPNPFPQLNLNTSPARLKEKIKACKTITNMVVKAIITTNLAINTSLTCKAWTQTLLTGSHKQDFLPLWEFYIST